MPLYSYIPYLDPEADEMERKSFSGHVMDDQNEMDDPGKLEVRTKTHAEIYKRKVNDNLKNLNLKMTNIIQDGLIGVDDLSKQVKGCLKDYRDRLDQRGEKSGRGDIFEYREEKKFNSPANESSQDAIIYMNPCTTTNCKQISANYNVFTLQNVTQGDKPENRHKTTNSRSRPASKSLKDKKSLSKCSRPTSKSLTSSKSSDSHNCEKTKTPKAKIKKTTTIEKDVSEEKKNAKRRLGQIERDYQKVVENLDMVERMMACINERVSHQKNTEKSKQDVVKKNGTNPQKSPECAKFKRRPIKSPETKSEHPEVQCIPDKEKQLELLDEMGERKIAEVEKRKIAQDTTRQIQEKKEQEKPKEEKDESIKLNETQKKAQELRALNPLSRMQIKDSLSDIDALIDNAVQELGNLAFTDFDISQNSSDVSFKLTTENDARAFYEECVLVNSSSTVSESEENAPLGEDSDKFEISKSFQELKDSYLQQLKKESETSPRKRTRDGKLKKGKKGEEVDRKSSFDRVHEDIFNDSSWNRIDAAASFDGAYINDKTNNSNSVCSLKTVQKNSETNVESLQEPRLESNYAVMEAVVYSKMEKPKDQGDDEDVITIPLPSVQDSSSKKSKCRKVDPKIQNNGSEQMDAETIHTTVTSKGDQGDQNEDSTRQACEDTDGKTSSGKPAVSDSEIRENFEANRRQERSFRKQQKKKIKDRKSGKAHEKNTNKERVNSRSGKSTPRNAYRVSQQAEGGDDDDDSPLIDVYRKYSAEDYSVNSRSTGGKARRRTKKAPDLFDDPDNPSKDIREIKKVESHFSASSASASSSSSLDESPFWAKRYETKKKQAVKPIDPMEQVSIQCKKLIGDLVVKEDAACLQKLMDGHFNSSLIQIVVGRTRRPRSVRIHTPIQDPDLRSIVPEVHRKRAISDLHDRMEYQIKQTDSFDGFLNLMNRNKRKALIKQAERQDHNFRCHMKTCFRKRYPFRVVTASVPPSIEGKSKDKKDPERKYINSLWFSPKDFKLRRNSRIFNRKRMEMYCQSLHKDPLIPRCKCKEASSKEGKRSEKASNYSILVRSGTPLGRRPNTPRRWIQTRPPSSGSQRPRLHHCDILDDLTIKDLAPFEAEYPRHDEKRLPESLQGSLLYKLACGGNKGDAEGTLMELIAPKLSCSQVGCKTCKPKGKSEKKFAKRQKTSRKSGDEASTPSKSNTIQALTPKAAAQLLIQNIGEIKSRKSSTKAQASEKSLSKFRETKTKRRNSRKTLSQDSKSTIHQKMEENLVRKIFYNQRVPMINFAQRSISTSPETLAKPFSFFKSIDPLEKPLKVPELYPKPHGKKSAVNKLFPYINDRNNKVFQKITVLPVEVSYDFESLKDTADEVEVPRTNTPINVACLSEVEELEVTTEYQRPLSAEQQSNKKRMNRRRQGTPRNPPQTKRGAPPAPKAGLSFPEAQKHSVELHPFINQPSQSHKMLPRKSRFKRSSSVGKSTESENGADSGRPTSKHSPKRPGNPIPWRPASRCPGPHPSSHTQGRKECKTNLQELQPSNHEVLINSSRSKEAKASTKQSLGNTVARRASNCDNVSTRTMCKHCEKSLTNQPKQPLAPQVVKEVLVNKDRKIKVDINPTKVFYSAGSLDAKQQSSRVSRNQPQNSPAPAVIVDHIYALKCRNQKLQNNIQKAINIIEEKMVDVLSTNDHSYKKKTIDRMEKDINRVLKMINEQNYETTNTGNSPNICQEVSDAKDKKETNPQDTPQRNESTPTSTKALITPYVAVKMPKPPRKRSVSRILRFQRRPYTVEENRRLYLPEDTFPLFKINESATNDEEEAPDNKDEDLVVEKAPEVQITRPELYPSTIMENDTSLCPILRCPSPKPSSTCLSLSKTTQGAIKKMSKEAFGKFAELVRTKTRLIINMTENIDVKESNILPSPEVTSALPAYISHPQTTL
ncbi:hypothetical protein HHI36_021341 [Cryptolaemus montrouzieri]|uniref:Uncharacterized protein n=1 Tax=Cryptolaemus montrouzieri TaxID=559131 RepID=A0ABD2MXE3_9CUCU